MGPSRTTALGNSQRRRQVTPVMMRQTASWRSATRAHRCAWPALLGLVATALLVSACSSDAGSSSGDTGAGAGTGGEPSSAGGAGAVTPVAVTCPGKLTPVAATGVVTKVGKGTTASCSEAALQAAVASVTKAGAGTISFDCGGKATIVLRQPLKLGSAKDKTVIIDGEGLVTLSGGKSTRVIDLENHTNFVVQRLSIIDGFVPAGEPEETNRPPNSGAAIRHPWFGTLKAIDVRFENNHCASRAAEIGGGAIYAGGLTEAVLSGCVFVNNSASNGGGILNRGSNLTVVNSQFSNNGALSSTTESGQFGNGGGVYIDGMNYEQPGGSLMLCGTAFRNNTAMTHGSGMFSYFYKGSNSVIRDCVFSANRFGKAGSGSGALYHEGEPGDWSSSLTLTGTTFQDHSTAQHAGALFLGQNSEATATNCTFANNKVTGNGAGVFNGAAIIHLNSCTFSGNDADYGPAIFKGKSANVTLKNTVFANNTTANKFSATSCHEAMTDQGGNLQWPSNKASGNPDQPCVAGIRFADPKLTPLGDNGGPSHTFALGPKSAAIGFGKACPATDQRGEPRATPCDSGAYEHQP